MTLRGWLVVAATAVGMGLLASSAEAAPVAGLSGLKPARDTVSGADKVFFCWFGCPRPYYGYPYYTYYRYPYRYPYYGYRYPYYGYYRPYRYSGWYGPRYRRYWW